MLTNQFKTTKIVKLSAYSIYLYSAFDENA